MRIAVLSKQVPVPETLDLGSDGRLRRDGLELEMNAFCRRAVAQGVLLARQLGGTCTVLTLAPPTGREVLREALSWGADRGVLITGEQFAGSDTLATSRALAAALTLTGPYDLVLCGRNSVDADTGQVGPAVAELLHLPYLATAVGLDVSPPLIGARLELDDGWSSAECALPAVVACAERLTSPCKVPASERCEVKPGQLITLGARDLGEGPWGQLGSTTEVGRIRVQESARSGLVLAGDLSDQVDRAVAALRARLDRSRSPVDDRTVPAAAPGAGGGPLVAALLEPGRPAMARELLSAASKLALQMAGEVVAVETGPISPRLSGSWGADRIYHLDGAEPQELSASLAGLLRSPWAVLAPSTLWGREVGTRLAVRLNAGLTGDAIDLEVANGRLVAWKPAFGGRMLAEIRTTSEVQMVTLRPGTTSLLAPRSFEAVVSEFPASAPGPVRVSELRRDDDHDKLANATAVVGVGAAVDPQHYSDLAPLLRVLGAELAGTRRVIDRGWLPKARQVGLTGRSISPSLYVALGTSGKYNHMVGVRRAGTILAVNSDPSAPVFASSDVGIVGDWQDVVPRLARALDRELPELAGQPVAVP